MNRVIFITGGARSGKSSFALKMATELPGKKVYIATAEPLDEEMRERIKRHKEERGEEWLTIEEPLKIAGLLRELKGRYDVLLLDCLTLWLSNMMLAKEVQGSMFNVQDRKGISEEIEEFITTLKDFIAPSVLNAQSSALVVVSNEVGMGIVPEKEVARRFRDLAGLLNQKVAEIADEVYLVISGIPLKIKGYG
ncbi:MAG: bifunctional adenosylcobinamide kinase/adenosylcobinamide-phosphate guanylyltransferase [Thermodesulfovibrionales bacterium]